jgi:hypothetical protein
VLLAGGDRDGAGDLGSDGVQGDELGSDGGHQRSEHGAEAALLVRGRAGRSW